MSSEDESATIFGVTVGDLQTDVVVTNDAINGTLQYHSDPTSQIVQQWGAGYFVALKFESEADKILAGLDPSEGSGLVQLDDDMNGVWKVTNKVRQNFKVISTKGTSKTEREFDLSGLELLSDED